MRTRGQAARAAKRLTIMWGLLLGAFVIGYVTHSMRAFVAVMALGLIWRVGIGLRYAFRRRHASQ